jgi:hypothetical protein
MVQGSEMSTEVALITSARRELKRRVFCKGVVFFNCRANGDLLEK